MADDFTSVMQACMSLLDMKFQLYEWSISGWNVLSFTVVSSIIAAAVWEVFNGK